MAPAAEHTTTGASVTLLGPARARRPTTSPASGRTRRAGTVTALHPAPQTADPTVLLDDGEPDPPQGTVRVELTDGRVFWTTMIRDYRPRLTDEDYAVLARLRDQARADIARRATDLPDAA